MKNITLVIGTLFLFSCGSTVNTVGLKHRQNIDVQLNQPMVRDIGEQLVVKGEENYQEAYKVTGAPQFKAMLLQWNITEGKILPLSGKTKLYDLYYLGEVDMGSMTYIQGIAKRISDGKLFQFINSVNGFSLKDIAGFSAIPTTYTDPNCSGCFKKEFIYNGKAGSSIKFVYREYVNNMARPAFNEDLQYDLAEGNIVGLKGLRIEVIKVTNTNIEYKVLSNFTE